MRKSLTLSFVTAAALLAAGAAHAQSTEAARPEPRSEMTRADVEQRTAERFGRMDANKDGLLNDADRDAARRQAFDAIDADKDGTISFAEFDAQRGERREARAERRGPGRPDAPDFDRRGGRGADIARAADADSDGTVTQAEFTSAALARFDRADADSDGTLSREERRETRQHMRHHRRSGTRDAG